MVYSRLYLLLMHFKESLNDEDRLKSFKVMVCGFEAEE
ncbi:hypothetical protein MNB_SM-7-1330 [hydrothermal vent metagenome]|uniref:Uncharacterized protein n=1 Tax=hydrothermal vent metagenome TaxID=652676 RepID=A0A1W1BY03_9ZZZZ